jgi:hypothetical protein
MNNEPVTLTQANILGILQDANSVPLGQPIFNSSEEYNKLKAIIESAIRYTHPVEEQDESFDRTASHMAGEYVSYQKELTDDEIKDLIQEYWGDVHIVDPDGYLHEVAFIKAILRKAQEK